MKALVICPADRPAAAFLARSRPLALVPVFGRSLLDLWLTELANRNVRHVTILAADRPNDVRRAVRHGEAWGIKVEVLPEPRESSPDAAIDRVGAVDHVVVLENIPPSGPAIWTSPANWFEELRRSMTETAGHRVGYRELSPGVWVHVRSRIASDARLQAPCWIGEHAWIGSRAQIGPETVIEDGAYVDDAATVARTWVGPGTYVGALTELNESLAWGHGLYKWTTGSFVEVADAFLLGETQERVQRATPGRMVERLAALAVLLVTWPVLLLGLLRRPSGEPLLRGREVLRTPTSTENPMVCRIHELAGFTGLWRRWPELWAVFRGDLAWVGNRPVTRDQAAELTDEFERLWLAVPAGVFSLADAEGCADGFGDEARAHASFYAVKHSWRTDLQILFRAVTRGVSETPAASKSIHHAST